MSRIAQSAALSSQQVSHLRIFGYLLKLYGYEPEGQSLPRWTRNTEIAVEQMLKSLEKEGYLRRRCCSPGGMEIAP